MKILLPVSFFLILAATLFAQRVGNSYYYLAYYSSTLSGAADAITIQAPTGMQKDAHFVYAGIYVSAPATVTVCQNGANATTTALTTARLNGAPPSQALAFSASNVGASAARDCGPPNTLPIGISNIDLGKYILTRGANSNLTISIATFTGTWQPTIQWSEQ